MSVLTAGIPTTRTDVHAPYISTVRREEIAHSLLEIFGALPRSGIRPPGFDTWWDLAAEALPKVYDAALYPFPEPDSARAEHRDIPRLSELQIVNERRLLNLRLSIQTFREWALDAPSPGPWLADRYRRLSEAISAR